MRSAESYAGLRKNALDHAARTEAEFRERLRREDVIGEWRFLESLPAETVALHARYADLTILGQVDPDATPSSNIGRIPEEVLFSSGGPMLVIPYAGRFESIGENVLVAWKPTSESARALRDSLPILQQAKKVTVLTVNPDRDGDREPGIPAADIANHLAHHGVNVEAASTFAEDIGTADVLLNHASDCGADLIVMGGYGHSRVTELVLGGVTREILHHMTVPVFMSH